MSDTKTLLAALKARKEQKKTFLEKLHELAYWTANLFGGVDSSYKVGTSAVSLDQSSISNTAQTGMSIAGLVLQVGTAIPALIAISTSKLPFKAKLFKIIPLLLLTAIGIAAGVLGVLVLSQIGGLVLSIAGAGLGLVAASIALGLMTYKLFKAYVAKHAIGTRFEQKVGTLSEIYDYFKALLNKEDIKIVADVDLPAKRKQLLIQLKEQLAKLDEDVIKQLSENALAANLSAEELKLVDEVQETLDQLQSCDQQIEDAKHSSLKLKHAIANENLVAAWVNLGLTVAGVILVVMGLMTLVATSIAFPPLLGGLILGVMGLSLTAFGLFKFGVEFNFAMDEEAVAEKKMDAQFEAAINEAPAVKPEANQQKVAVDLSILGIQRHIQEKLKHYKKGSSSSEDSSKDKVGFFIKLKNLPPKTEPIAIPQARSPKKEPVLTPETPSSKMDSYDPWDDSIEDSLEDSLEEKDSLLNHH
jgi:hypothetical protein